MQEKTLFEGLKQEMRGLKDPGNALILVYILLVLALLLFAGLQSAKADFSEAKEGAISLRRSQEVISSEGYSSSLVDHFLFLKEETSTK